MSVLRRLIPYLLTIKYGPKCHNMKRNTTIVTFRRISNRVQTFNPKDSKNYVKDTTNYLNNLQSIKATMRCNKQSIKR